MVAASNTSPVSNLALIGRLDLLGAQFQEVWIPDAVQRELDRLPSPAGRSAIRQATHAGWLRCRKITNTALAFVLAIDLDRGEAEAITLAAEIPADLLLIDEKDGRLLARQTGIRVRGVLGMLIRAKAMGKVSSVKSEIDALTLVAGFFIARVWSKKSCGAPGE
jgi:hypothetical protein